MNRFTGLFAKQNLILTELLAILAKSIAITIAILGGKSIATLIAIPFFKSVLQYYCNTFCSTPLFALPR